jgi:hypothetical protein
MGPWTRAGREPEASRKRAGREPDASRTRAGREPEARRSLSQIPFESIHPDPITRHDGLSEVAMDRRWIPVVRESRPRCSASSSPRHRAAREDEARRGLHAVPSKRARAAPGLKKHCELLQQEPRETFPWRHCATARSACIDERKPRRRPSRRRRRRRRQNAPLHSALARRKLLSLWSPAREVPRSSRPPSCGPTLFGCPCKAAQIIDAIRLHFSVFRRHRA